MSNSEKWTSFGKKHNLHDFNVFCNFRYVVALLIIQIERKSTRKIIAGNFVRNESYFG